MNARICFVISALALAASGCFQELDPSVATGTRDSTFVVDGGLDDGAPIPTLPAPFTGQDVDAALNQQCAYGSALCYQICGSPSCANLDNTIPGEVTTVPSVLPDGGTTADPCDVVRAQSLLIRQQSCSQCHGPPPAPGFNKFDFVLDDQALVTTIPTTVQAPLIIPGNPSQSVLLERVSLGLSGGQTGMPPSPSQITGAQLVKPSIAKTVVYPTSEELSILYAWILNCVPGTDGGAYSSSYYGGNYAPDASTVTAPGQTASRDAGGGG